MAEDKTIHFPDNFSELKTKMPAEDAGILSVVTLSGKGLGAYYARNKETGEFELCRQVSLEPGIRPAFPPKAAFADDLNHISVRDEKSRIKGFFDLRYAPVNFQQMGIGPQFTEALTKEFGSATAQDISRALLTPEYNAEFVRNYMTPPEAVQHAYKDMADIMAKRLFSSDPRSKKPANDTPEECNALFARIDKKLQDSQTLAYVTPDGVNHMLPDDNFRHTQGVSLLTGLTAQAVNEVAAEHDTSPPFDRNAVESMRLMGLVHDIGKVQIRTRLNPFELGLSTLSQEDRKKTPDEQETILKSIHYLTPQDNGRPANERWAIHKLKDIVWRRTNFIHPMLGYVAFSLYPEMAEAFALHHLSLYRDEKDPLKRAQNASLMLIPHDLGAPVEVPYISQMFRVADVTDAIINNNPRGNPAKMLKDLDAKTHETNHMGFDGKGNGLPSINPDILCFMLHRGVIDTYLMNKVLSPRKAGDPDTPIPELIKKAGNPPVLELPQDYLEEKKRILKAHGYMNGHGHEIKENIAEMEHKILSAVQKEPFIKLFAPISAAPPAPGEVWRPYISRDAPDAPSRAF